MNDFKRRTFVSSALILGSFVGFGVLIYFMLYLIDGVAEDVVADRRLTAERTYALDHLGALKKHAPEALELQKKIDVLLPSEDDLFPFSEFMENTAKVHGMDLSFSFGDTVAPVAGREPGYITFNAIVSGSLDNTKNFVNNLENTNTRFIIAVDQVTITAQGSQYRSSVQGRVFFK